MRPRGVIASLVASFLFGVIFFAAGVLRASPEAIVAWRVVMTCACYGSLLLLPSARRLLREFWQAVSRRWWIPLVFLVQSALAGLQLWLFAWTPVHGHALDASLGYLLLPIALVALGRIVFRAYVTRLQWIAVGIAVVAVGTQLIATLSISWVTLAVSLGYAAYFGVRRSFRLETPAAFGVEMLVLSPFAVVLILTHEGAPTAFEHLLVLAAGVAGALGMTAYLAASRLLSMPVFGLLTYVEPVLLFIVALVLGESLQAVDLAVYGLLALALAVLGAGGFRTAR